MQETVLISLPVIQLQALIIDCVKSCLEVRDLEHNDLVQNDQWFNLTDLCNYLPDKPAKATIYGYVAANSIPHHKGAKKLRFLKSEIDAWIKTGKVKSPADHAADADNFLDKHKRRRQVA